MAVCCFGCFVFFAWGRQGVMAIALTIVIILAHKISIRLIWNFDLMTQQKQQQQRQANCVELDISTASNVGNFSPFAIRRSLGFGFICKFRGNSPTVGDTRKTMPIPSKWRLPLTLFLCHGTAGVFAFNCCLLVTVGLGHAYTCMLTYVPLYKTQQNVGQKTMKVVFELKSFAECIKALLLQWAICSANNIWPNEGRSNNLPSLLSALFVGKRNDACDVVFSG